LINESSYWSSPRERCISEIVARLRDGRYPHGQLIPEWAAILAEMRDLGHGANTIFDALQELEERQLLTRDGTGYRAGPRKPAPQAVNPPQ